MTSPPRPRPVPVVGRVESVEPIPNADHVRLARVSLGGGETLSIVFGGTNPIAAGDLVPVAPPGSWVPGPRGNRREPVKMRPRRYRGHRSEGMLCSLLELGWARSRQASDAPETRDHVAVLRADVLPGQPLPDSSAWRDVVAHPCPDDFDPNTAELSRAAIESEFRW